MNTSACTMPTAERPVRLAEFDALFSESVRSVTYERDFARMHLTGPVGLRERVRDLAERETACCSFFSFVVDADCNDVTLEVTVPPEHREILKALVSRAVTMSA